MPSNGDWNGVPSLPQAVADWIATGIVNGRWREGDRLRESEIATELGISRAPLREGIRMLHERGLLEHKARVGATVREFSLQTIRDVYALRAAVESWVIRQSVPNLGPADREELAKHLADIRAAYARDDRDAFFAAGWQFRQALYRGYPNAIARDVVNNMRARLHSLPQVLRREQSFVDGALATYNRVAQCVDLGQADEAAQIIEDMLHGSAEKMCEMLAEGPSESMILGLPASKASVD